MKVLFCMICLAVTVQAIAQVSFETTNITTGKYILAEKSDPRCEGDVIDLMIEKNPGNTVLVLGTNSIFVHLEKSEFSEKGLKNCQIKYLTKIEKNKLTQKIVNICDPHVKKDNYEKSLIISRKSNTEIQFEFSAIKPKLNKYKCDYILHPVKVEK